MSIFDFWVTSFKNRSDFGCHLVARVTARIRPGRRRSRRPVGGAPRGLLHEDGDTLNVAQLARKVPTDVGSRLAAELHPRTRQLIQGGSRRSSLLAILRQQILGRHDKNFPPAA
jgi:hypothetical protein